MNLADAQNRAGLADLLTVLDAEPTLFTNQELLAQSQTRSLWTLSPYTKPWAEAGSLFRWKPTLEVAAVRRRWLNFERRNHRPRWEP